MKKRIAAAAVLTAVMAFTGCSESILTSQNGTSSEAESIWTADDNDIVAWSANESLSAEEKEYYDIKFKDFYSEYSYIIDSDKLDETNPQYLGYAKSYRKYIIDFLSNERIILKKAKELGLDSLSEDEMKKVDEAYREVLKKGYEKFEYQAKSALGLIGADTESGADGQANKDRVEEKEKELYNAHLEKFGMSEETILKQQTDYFIKNKVVEHLVKDVTVPEAEAQKYIDETIAEAKKAYEKDVTSYEKSAEYQSVWIPEGSREIKYIFIAMDSSDAVEIAAARAESGADNAEIDKIRDEKLAEIKDKADAAYAKASAEGADFDAVIKEYSNDYTEATGINTVLAVKGSKSLSESLYDGIFAIEKTGGISNLIPTDGGYYIIQYVGDRSVTDAELKEVKEAKHEDLLNTAKGELIQETVEKWREEIGYEYDYEKLNFEKPEEDSDDTASSDDKASDTDSSAESSAE